MSDPNKIHRDIQRPYHPEEKEKPAEKVDPEKFKKVMKVDESDEAQKRRKRNLKKEEEEGEEKEVQPETPAPREGFAELMSDQDEVGGIMDKESAGVRYETPPEEETPFTPPPPGSIPTEGVEIDEVDEPLPPPQQEEQTPEQETPPPPTTPEKKEKPEDASLLASQPKKSELEALKKKKKPQTAAPAKKKRKTAPKKKKEALEEKPIEETPPKKPSIFHHLSPKEIREQKITQAQKEAKEFAPPPPEEGEQEGMGQRKKKDDDTFIEATPDTASVPLPSFDAPLPPVIPSDATPAFSHLSPEVYELFERVGGVMIIQQDMGVTTTTMNIDMPDSVFHGAQIIVDHYSTAPHAYNIQLVGNPESVKLFTENLDALKNSFIEGNFKFEANILNPVLQSSKKSPHLIRRKGAAGDKGGKGGKKK
ncbi:hypothetical protein [Candidatus Neptunochlamydia vexilliferae]|uniref:Uncharacterized protein n=1 Tax=Candidatus Neptunichlamydia vexilliferae TaxID=1651774 RepID=A0ABS0B164_9BACT|nr:hypothetical protein [Candidatus Neptunochlamydia vexilliferae]MBF5060133.1 hypothetical protein [Candidatus Neptunochlamydia vexilliferae]